VNDPYGIQAYQNALSGFDILSNQQRQLEAYAMSARYRGLLVGEWEQDSKLLLLEDE